VAIYILLDQRKDLDLPERQELIRLVLKDDWQGVRSVLDVSSTEGFNQVRSRTEAWINSTLRYFTDEASSSRPKLLQEARNIAAHTSDSDFLLRLKDISADDDTLKKAVADTENIAHSFFDATISKLLKKLVHGVLRIQQEDCSKQIQREASSQVGKDIDRFRTEFLRGIEELSQSESIS
jgi:hypothetical protein